MSNLASVDIKERERINATLTFFLSLSAWTPAMGALLVSGIIPVGKPTAIPTENNCSLRNPAVPASEHEIQRAHQVLENWIEWNLDTADRTSIQALNTCLSPLDFLRWCVEDYEDLAEWSWPGWLRYWTSFVGWEDQSGVPLPAPGILVARAAELEHVASFIRFERPDIEATSMIGPVDNVAYVALMRASILANPKSPIASLIVQALASSDDPQSPLAVWVQLCKMAESKKHAALKYVDDTTLKIPEGGRGWTIYTKDGLQQYLNRYKRKVTLADQSTPNG